MKIALCGTGYVGLSLAILLSQRNNVYALDIIPQKVEMINNRISPIKDEYIEKYLKKKNLNLRATLDYKEALTDADYVIVCTPTNYNEVTNYFDTSNVEDIIKKVIEVCDLKKTSIVIKSTIPVGFIEKMKKKYRIKGIFFSPEFLREGKALYDNLYPSRIIVGDKTKKAKKFAKLLKDASLKKDVKVLFMNNTEAEAVKLFANTYLALRVSYFNELDTYAEEKGLNTKDIIEGVCLDPRIGNYYNNPSFGYGGYCLPKDTKQLLANFKDVPQNMIGAIVKSNDTRKEHIAKKISNKKPNVVGIYRLTMKSGSDNYRSSAIQGIIEKLKDNNIKIIIYEPSLNVKEFNNLEVLNDLNAFKSLSDVILVNRYNQELNNVRHKIYTRDIFSRD
ncbi:MAG: nucleotide sugar dehydrogenase [Bacilli bacterium]|nr:nucleotide sugar dehydrogenase [Bacilli bacterium]